MKLPLILAAAGLALTIAPTTSSSAADGAPPPSIDPNRVVKPSDLIEQFSEDTGVSLPDATNAYDDHFAIGDFVTANAGANDVGSVWVTYENGYQVHARIVSDRNAHLVDDLEARISDPIVRHSSGPSNAALLRAAEYLGDHYPGQLFALNIPDGYVDVDRPVVLPEEVIEPSFVRVTDNWETYEPASGGYHWMNWNGTIYVDGCSVGYELRIGSTGNRYIATAGHCVDGWHNSYSNYASAGETYNASNSYEVCDEQDLQIQRFNGGVDRWLYDFPLGNWSELERVSDNSRWWVGAWTATYGHVTGFNWGTLTDYKVMSLGGGTDCGVGFYIVGFNTTNVNQNGDSGAPMVLLYGGKFELLGTLSGVTATTSGAATAFDNWLPTGAHICTVQTSAGCT
jgi:hypothetical protein